MLQNNKLNKLYLNLVNKNYKHHYKEQFIKNKIKERKTRPNTIVEQAIIQNYNKSK